MKTLILANTAREATRVAYKNGLNHGEYEIITRPEHLRGMNTGGQPRIIDSSFLELPLAQEAIAELDERDRRKSFRSGKSCGGKPSIGRIVHYRSYGTPGGEYQPEPRAAIITAVAQDEDDIRVSLCVLNPTGVFFTQNVSYSVSTPGCWFWPPREPSPEPAQSFNMPLVGNQYPDPERVADDAKRVAEQVFRLRGA